VALCFLEHVANILLLTTIVRPTYSVYCYFSTNDRSARGNLVSSPETTRLPALIARKRTRQVVDAVALIVDDVQVSDEVLMGCIVKGNKEALADLFRRYARVVRAVAYRVLRDASEADDLVQDIFLLVQRDCVGFDSSKGSARFWILQMTYRRAISRRRYLTSRHFYTRLDLDDETLQLADARTPVVAP
jgi:RNA polymerase sigma-70 factor, ECF subfamily